MTAVAAMALTTTGVANLSHRADHPERRIGVPRRHEAISGPLLERAYVQTFAFAFFGSPRPYPWHGRGICD